MDYGDRSVIYKTARSLIHRKKVTKEEINWVLGQLPHDCDRALGLRVRLICKKAGEKIDWGTVNRLLVEKLGSD